MTQIAANSDTRPAHAHPALRAQPARHTRQALCAWSLGLLCTLMVPWATPALATMSTCTVPNCPEGCGEATVGGTAIWERSGMASRYLPLRSDAGFRPDLGKGSPLAQRLQRERAAAARPKGALPGQSLFGELPGTWDYVTGYVTFPYLLEGSTPDQLLLRGLPTERLTGDLYQVQGWQRSAYWIDAGDGIPRVLASELIMPGYVPDPADPFTDSGDLNFGQLILYREAGRDYSSYPEGGAFGTLWFVADPQTGEVIDAIVDLYDAASEYEKTVFLFEGDSLKPLLITYRLSEPEFLYYAEYGDFIPLTQDVSIGLANHVPGVDFVDPFLNAIGFDANQPLELLLEGYLDLGNGEAQWAYSEVYPLGYNWPEAADRLFAGDFEALAGRPDGTPPRRIVRPRQ